MKSPSVDQFDSRADGDFCIFDKNFQAGEKGMAFGDFVSAELYAPIIKQNKNFV